MAQIVNPYDLDVDDDAIFSAAISFGLIAIVDDDEGDYSIDEFPPLPPGMRPHRPNFSVKQESIKKAIQNYNSTDVFQAARDFIDTRNEDLVNFDRLSQHLYERFHNLKSAKLGQTDKKNNSLIKFFGKYPSHFELRLDEEKPGLHWIRLKQKA